MLNEAKSRRSFLKAISKGIASLFAYIPFAGSLWAKTLTESPRTRVPNPFIAPNGRPILVCVKGANFQSMLNAGLYAIGGLDRLIDNNQDILIKPNCVHTEGYPTTSSLDAIVATIEAARSVTTGIIKVGDGGAIDNQEIYEYLNLEPAVTQAGGTLVTFSDTYEVRHDNWPPEVPDFMVFTDVYDAPIIINLCNLKRHYKAFLTCAIKHHVGTVSGPNRIDTRHYIHTFPDQSLEFLEVLAELAGLINPELTIVDARSIMTVNGPIKIYNGEVRDIDRIVICGDMVAVDAYCAKLMEDYDETFEAAWIEPTLTRAEELGLGTAHLNQVEIIEFSVTPGEDDHISARPGKLELHQNYPNPFNPTTNIVFTLPASSFITLKVYDMLGRETATLASGEYAAGVHSVTFDGGRLAGGAYVYRLTTPYFTRNRAMVLAK